jgi:hypothetical protein
MRAAWVCGCRSEAGEKAAGGTPLAFLDWLLDAICKSFLVLFFKKEQLPSA